MSTVPAHHPERDAFRLSAEDEARASARMAEVVATWKASTGHALDRRSSADAITVLIRVGAHAIGCSVDDLRDCELDWLTANANLAVHKAW